ncbi:hypothetical protein GCM10010990_34540 [Croceicoccus mobilis]|uniref:Uncharacterized protein n=1 Tax=Croceicoccus mobilis TaxID=1703339 RepID=A0A916Z9W5_9SPHN|nr:hypothetical protein GCM10010990_34540 [Croceicoccus mobilis]
MKPSFLLFGTCYVHDVADHFYHVAIVVLQGTSCGFDPAYVANGSPDLGFEEPFLTFFDGCHLQIIDPRSVFWNNVLEKLIVGPC